MNVIDGKGFRPAGYALKSVIDDIERLIIRIEENRRDFLTYTEMRFTTILQHDEIDEKLMKAYKYILYRAYEVESKTGSCLYEIVNKVHWFEPECRKALELNKELHSKIEFAEGKIRGLQEIMYSASGISVADLNRWYDSELENKLLKNLHQLVTEISLIQNKLEKLLEALQLPDEYMPPLSKNNLV